MQFPKSYFEDEVRDGYYVPSLMKSAWAAQLEILEDIDKVCKKYNIQYFAEWGTLLGAVRHNGFVPWDDDMDICMKRKDYDTFCKVAPGEMSEWYSFLNFEHSNDTDYTCDDFLTRLYNGNRIRIDKPFLDKFHGFPYVAGMDIFPLDYMAPTEKEDKMQCEQIKVLSTLAQAISVFEPDEREQYIKQVEDTYNIKLDRNTSLRVQIYMLADQICGMYHEDESKYLASMALRTIHDYKVPKEYYADVIWMPFETTQIPVPIGYDGILKIKYGDYMRPVRDGGAHEYPFYQKQAVEYEKTQEPLFKTYKFSENDLKREGNVEQMTLKSMAENMVGLFGQACAGVIDSLAKDDAETALGLLEDCQDGAIALGNKIEEIKGEGYPTVHILEQFCEALYVLHEAIMDGNVIDEPIAALNESLNAVEQSVKKDILQRKEAVFLPYKASMWDSLESVWKAADEDPDCDAYVIPIPYYDKKFDGSFGELHYEGAEYPDYVPVVDYQTFDFGTHHPDMIFIHNPYDEFNRVTSVHPFFYSKNLKQFTDKLVYIPYFVLDEIKPTDERAVKGMKHFCTMPGVVNADVVIVQSEDMKRAYVKALTDFAGEDTKSVWEEKILGLGSPKFDRVLDASIEIQVPEEWKKVLYKEDGSRKKVILYNIGLGSMLEHREAMLDKIENVLKTFQKSQDKIALLWRPHPLIPATIQSMRPELWERYKKIVKKYQDEGWGIYDDTVDLDRAIRLADAYYGDPSSVIQLCKKAGMPVMVQNVSIFL